MKRREVVFSGLGALVGAGAGLGWPYASSYFGGSPVQRGGGKSVWTDTEDANDHRLPAGARVAMIGDSIFAGASSAYRDDTYFSLTHNMNGELIWAMFADPRFTYQIWEAEKDRNIENVLWDGDNQGVGGSRANRLVDPAEIAKLRELDPDVVIVGFGANDIPLGSSAGDFINRLVSFCDEMVNKDGRFVVVATVRPHVASGTRNGAYDYPPGDHKWVVHTVINDFIYNQLSSKFPPGKVLAWDTFGPLADPQSYLGSEYRPQYTRDGVHLTDEGAYWSGMALPPVLDRIIKPGYFFDPDPTKDNLLPNPRLEGKIGLLTAGASGTLPSDMRIDRTSGQTATLTASMVPDGKFGGDALVLTIDGHDAEEMQEFSLRFHTDRFLAIDGLAGKFAQLYVPVRIDPYANFIGATAYIANDSFSRFTEGMRPLDKTKPSWPGVAMEGWIVTPALQLTDPTAGIRAGLTIRMASGAGLCSVTIRPNVIARVISDPRIRTQSAS